MPGGLTALHGDSRESVAMMSEAVDAAGVHRTLAMPLRPHQGGIQRIDLRNHRKMLIADGRVAYTGSMNMIDPHDENRGNQLSGRQWVDTKGRYEGPTTPPR